MLTRENRESATYDVNQRARGRTPKKTETSHDNREPDGLTKTRQSSATKLRRNSTELTEAEQKPHAI